MSYNMGVAEGHLDLDFSDLRTATASAVRELDKLERAGNLSQSQMNKLEAATKGTAGVFEQANQKAASLSKQIDNAKQKVSVYKTAIDGLNDIIKRNASEQESLRGKISAANATLDKAEQKVKELSGAHRTATQEAESAAEAVKAAAKQYGEESDEVKKATAAHEDAVKAQKEAKEAYDKAAESAQKHRNELLQLESREASLGRETEDSKAKINDFAAKINNTEADIANMSRELQTAESKLATFGAAAQTAGEKWKTAGDKISKAGNALTIGVSVPLATAGVSVFKAASDFESAFTGVEKTVDATDQQLAALKQGIIDMSQEIPASTTTIAAVAEAAGQLGIQTDNILSFTRVMVDLGNATNLSAEDAASALAKFANVTGMSQTDFDKLGATIVALGNNFATTEADIVAMGTRLAGAGSQVGMTEPQIMGLATALSSVGIEAEMGGSAFSTLMSKMQLSVEQGGEGLKAFADVAGMSAEQFQTAFKEDAAGAIVAFIQGLSNCEDKGKSAIGVLDDMGITEIRQRDALLRAAGASDVFTEAIQMGSQAWEENTALTNEASKRYETTESQLQMAKNAIIEAARSLGQLLIPEVTDIAKQVKNAADKFAKLDDKTKKNIISIAKFAIAIGPVTKGLGLLTKGIGTAKSAFGVFSTALGKTQKFGVAKKAIAGLVTKMGAFGASAGAATLAVGAWGAVLFGVPTLIRQSLKKADLEKRFGSVTLSVEELQEAAKELTDTDYTLQIDLLAPEVEKLNGLEDEIESAVETINKLNWKVSVGLKLTDDEKQSYQDSVNTFINQSIAWLEQQQYTVSIAFNAVFGENSNMSALAMSYYNGLNADLTKMGDELSKIVNDAFADGVLTEDEALNIEKAKAKIQNYMDGLANLKFEAHLERIALDYGSDLTADSFADLSKEIDNEIKTKSSENDENFEFVLRNLKAIFNDQELTEESQAAYDKAVEALQTISDMQDLDVEINGLHFKLDAVNNAFSEELNASAPVWRSSVNDISAQIIEQASQDNADVVGVVTAGIDDMVQSYNEQVQSLHMDEGAKATLKQLYADLGPTYDQLQAIKKQCLDTGQAVPEYVKQGITDIDKLGALMGDTSAIYELIGEQLSDSPEFVALLEQAKASGGDIPDVIGQGVDLGKLKTVQSCTDLVADAQETLNNYLLLAYPELQEASQNFGFALPYGLVTSMSTKEPDVQSKAAELIKQISIASDEERPALLQQLSDLGISGGDELITAIDSKKAETDAVVRALLSLIPGASDEERASILQNLRQLGIDLSDEEINAIAEKAPELNEESKESANQVIAGFKDTIENNGGDATSAVGTWAGEIHQRFKDDLGIHSPSVLFAEAGENVVLGFNKGVEDNKESSATTIGSFVDTIKAALDGGKLPDHAKNTGKLGSAAMVAGMIGVDTAAPAAKKVTESTKAMDTTFNGAKLDNLGAKYGIKPVSGFAHAMEANQYLVNAQTSAIAAMVDAWSSFPSYTWGTHLVQGFSNGIYSMIGQVRNAAYAVASAAQAALHFTRPDEGPLRNYEQWPVHFISRYAELMQKQKSKVQQAALAVANCAADALSTSAVGKDFDLNQYAFNDFRGTMTIRADADLIDYDRLADALAARFNDRPIVVESRIDNHTTVEMDKEIVGRKVAPVVSKVIAKNSKLHK